MTNSSRLGLLILKGTKQTLNNAKGQSLRISFSTFTHSSFTLPIHNRKSIQFKCVHINVQLHEQFHIYQPSKSSLQIQSNLLAKQQFYSTIWQKYIIILKCITKLIKQDYTPSKSLDAASSTFHFDLSKATSHWSREASPSLETHKENVKLNQLHGFLISGTLLHYVNVLLSCTGKNSLPQSRQQSITMLQAEKIMKQKWHALHTEQDKQYLRKLHKYDWNQKEFSYSLKTFQSTLV